VSKEQRFFVTTSLLCGTLAAAVGLLPFTVVAVGLAAAVKITSTGDDDEL
jgi:hypothetical protein